jgi:hypothetical protein
MTEDARHFAFATLAATPGALQALVAGLPQAMLDEPADGGWSPKDVVAHLVVSGRLGAIARIRSIVESDHPLLQNYDDEEELRRSGLASAPPASALAEFAATRATDLEWLHALPVAAFERRGRHSVAGEVSAGELLYHAAYHDSAHLAQLAQMLASRFDPLRGPLRVF